MKVSAEFVLRLLLATFLVGVAVAAWIGFQGMLLAHEAALQALQGAKPAVAQQFAAEAAAREGTVLWLLIGVLVVGAFAALGFRRWITRTSGAPLRVTMRMLRQVSEGDLTAEVEDAETYRRVHNVGRLIDVLEVMTGNLRTLVGEVAHCAHTVADTSAQIAQGNVDLSQRTEEQASTLEETASSMEQLTSTVAQNAENARQASQLAVGASDVARKGGQVVGQVVATMGEISAASRRIGDIIGVIDGIAFQTNILALNAAVEAARAGEQGRGFAVVAAEVRNLAQRSAAAAKEIKTLIGDSVDKVEAGTKLVDNAGKTMQEIVGSVKKVSDLIAEIAAASQEQSQGIHQVNSAVSQMEQVVQQNASLVEEATAAAESMKEQADTLLHLVSRFKVGDAAPVALTPLAPAPVRAAAPAPAMAPIKVRPAAAALEASAPRKARASGGEWEEF